MPLLQVLFVLIVVGIVLWLINTFCSEFIDGKILKLINIVVVVAAILWILSLFFGGIGSMNSVHVGK